MTEIVKHETLAEAVCAAMLEMTYVDKSGVNQGSGGKFNYRTIDDVMYGVRQPLIQHGVFPHVTFGKVRPVVDDPEDSNYDPHYLVLPVKLTLRHAHSSETFESTIEARGRQAGSGNVSNPDPRALGQAASYGMKTLLVNQFMLAGGDDGVDEATTPEPAPKSRAKKEKAEQAPADPELEDARTGMLADIASLAPEVQAKLADALRAEQLSVKKATSMAELERVAEIMADIEDAEPESEPEPEPEPEVEPEVTEPEAAEDEEPETDEGDETERQLTAEEEAAVLAAARAKVAEDRHLTAVPDVEEAPAEEPAAEEAKPARKPRRTKDTITPPVDDGGIDDMQLAYLVASGGLGTSAAKLGGDMRLVKKALDIIKDLKANKIIREGFTFVDADTKEVTIDGTEAVAQFRAS